MYFMYFIYMSKKDSGSWEKFLDEIHGVYYWYNHTTGVTQWENPFEHHTNADQPSEGKCILSRNCLLYPKEFEERWMNKSKLKELSIESHLSSFPDEYSLSDFLQSQYFWIIAYGYDDPIGKCLGYAMVEGDDRLFMFELNHSSITGILTTTIKSEYPNHITQMMIKLLDIESLSTD